MRAYLPPGVGTDRQQCALALRDYANLIKSIGPIVQRETTGPLGTHKDFAREGIVVFF